MTEQVKLGPVGQLSGKIERVLDRTLGKAAMLERESASAVARLEASERILPAGVVSCPQLAETAFGAGCRAVQKDEQWAAS